MDIEVEDEKEKKRKINVVFIYIGLDNGFISNCCTHFWDFKKFRSIIMWTTQNYYPGSAIS